MKTIRLFAFVLLALLWTASLQAQKYMTKNGMIRFYSEAPAENIEAINKQVNSALDIGTGDFVFRVLMKAFEFEKALMQEHFNENYVESHKHPNASFTGKITNFQSIDFAKDGTYEADIEGDLTIKGITKKINEKGSFEVKDSAIRGKSVFMVTLSDFDIKIPRAVVSNIAEKIEVTVDVSLQPLNK
jgi:hypothetical protein